MPAQASEPQFYIDSENPHLGGYIVGGDDATYYPDLWRWLVEERGVRSIVDVGCGEGHALRFFRELGCEVLGLDGVAQDDPDIVQHDYARLLRGRYEPRPKDLAWSCEFVEHVEEWYVPNFLATFARARLVLMTHAQPDQPGYHHVNCQPASYWIGAMAAIGYSLDEELTTHTRLLAGMNRNPYNHYARSGLVFDRHR